MKTNCTKQLLTFKINATLICSGFAHSHLSPGAYKVSAILFFWQIPHIELKCALILLAIFFLVCTELFLEDGISRVQMPIVDIAFTFRQ